MSESLLEMTKRTLHLLMHKERYYSKKYLSLFIKPHCQEFNNVSFMQKHSYASVNLDDILKLIRLDLTLYKFFLQTFISYVHQGTPSLVLTIYKDLVFGSREKPSFV
ncbi:unnamed protein product [Ixodes pacificus]